MTIGSIRRAVERRPTGGGCAVGSAASFTNDTFDNDRVVAVIIVVRENHAGRRDGGTQHDPFVVQNSVQFLILTVRHHYDLNTGFGEKKDQKGAEYAKGLSCC